MSKSGAFRIIQAILALCFAAGFASAAFSADWPQWRGPNRDGIAPDTGLLAAWPKDGPPVLWRKPCGKAYSQITVAGDKAYTLTSEGKAEYVVCLNPSTGDQIWRTMSEENVGAGGRQKVPNATPLADDGLVYSMGCNGHLLCLKGADGGMVWEHRIFADFGGENDIWGFASSPLLVDDMIIVPAGGKDGKGIVALDKKTGKLRWSGLETKINHSSPIVCEIGGIRQIVFFAPSGAEGVSAADGKEFWSFPWNPMNPYYTTPICHDGKIFAGSHKDQGAMVFEVKSANGKFTAEKVWQSMEFQHWFGTPVLIDGFLYGFGKDQLKCVELATGKERWTGGGYGRGQVIAADGKLIVLGETGKLGLVECTPEGFHEISQFEPLKGKSHTIPSLSGGKLYLRNWTDVVCFNLKP